MGKGGWKGMVSEKEKAWTYEVIKKLQTEGKVISSKLVRELDLVKKYNKKFSKKLSEAGLFNRIWRYAHPDSAKATRRKNKPEYVFENSKFIVYIKGAGIFGYDTAEEAKASLEQGKVSAFISIFKKVESNIEYKVTIGS